MKGVLHNGMSLFQDLKLKRRKVDSRCSSDGESIGTSDSTSSLSPDAQNQSEGSPKGKDRCITPEDLVVVPPSSKSNSFPPQFFIMAMKTEPPPGSRKDLKGNSNPSSSTISSSSSLLQDSCKTNGVIKLTNHNVNGGRNGMIQNGTSNSNSVSVSVVVKSEPGDEDDSPTPPPQSNKLLKGAGNSPDRKSPETHNSNQRLLHNGHHTLSSFHHSDTNGHNGNGNNSNSDNESTASSIKAEKMEDMDITENTQDGDDNDTEKMSPRPSLSRSGSTTGISSSPSPPRSNGSSHSTLIITKQNKEGGGGSSTSSRSSSRGPSPPQQSHNGGHNNGHQLSPMSSHLHMSGNSINSNSHHLQQQQSQQQHHHYSNQLHARLTAGNRERDNGGGENNNNNGNNLRNVNVPSPLVHVEIRNLTEKNDPPLSVVTSTSLSFHHHSMYRINGVRPEVISGGAVTPTVTSPGGTPSGTPSSMSLSNGNPNMSNGHGGHHNNHLTNNNNNNSHLSPPNHLTQHPGSLHQQHHLNHQLHAHTHSHALHNGHSNNNNMSGHPNRKSPTLSHHSRSPNSSPSNSSSSGSIINGSLHSPSGGQGTIVAGGSLGMVNSSTGSSNHHHHVNLNRTPTVIMGEAGGVRTMLWSQPGQPLPNSAMELGVGGPGVGGNAPMSSGSSTSSGSLSNGHILNGGSPNSNSNGYGHPSPPSNSSSNGGNSNGAHLNLNGLHGQSPPGHHMTKGALSMERLWASEALNLSTGAGATNSTNSNGINSHMTNGNGHHNGQTNGNANNSHQLQPDDDDYEQPMICMICEDRATGLHYGIITCEGCKGFFKRTVQNRRVYTCVADGTCEITKAQRNRCQYCRFKKCIEQGMVLQAVREDRMPGGRNSGAVYNLYKVPVKYRKHKKGNRGAGAKGADKNSNNNNNNNSTNLTNNNSSNNNINNNSNNGNNNLNHNGHPHPPNSQLPPMTPLPSLPLQNGNILKAALQGATEVTQLRQSLQFDTAAAMINHLVQCDNFHDIAALQNWEELLEARGDLSDKLCKMGDSIVYRLVQWTKRLPFYQEVPVDVHTRVLTHKWHELLVLTTSAWQAMNTPAPPANMSAEEETMENLQVLQRCLQAMMGRSLTLEQLRQDVGQMVERLTHLTRAFRRLGIRIEEYVSLKVIAMLQPTGNKAAEVGAIQERYVKCLRTFLEVTCPSHPNRLSDLLRCLPEVQAAASLLLESKMFYVPFLLNSALLQR